MYIREHELNLDPIELMKEADAHGMEWGWDEYSGELMCSAAVIMALRLGLLTMDEINVIPNKTKNEDVEIYDFK